MHPLVGPNVYYYPSAGPAVPPPPIGAPYAFQMQQGPQLWSTGLCACTDDCSSCSFLLIFYPQSITSGFRRDSCGSSAALYALSHITCCQWIYSCFYRSKMRTQYCLVERPYNDCLVHLFCEKCGLCQEYRELKNRGFDMRI
uniref:Cell number regulator 2 n=1 Tax=Elaeis guineensis var. tenera TaxID=51953 RepID=A0A8N4ESP2_ELAGV